MFLRDRKRVLKLPFKKAREPEVELLVSKWVPENQICKIIELLESVETILLKF